MRTQPLSLLLFLACACGGPFSIEGLPFEAKSAAFFGHRRETDALLIRFSTALDTCADEQRLRHAPSERFAVVNISSEDIIPGEYRSAANPPGGGIDVEVSELDDRCRLIRPLWRIGTATITIDGFDPTEGGSASGSFVGSVGLWDGTNDAWPASDLHLSGDFDLPFCDVSGVDIMQQPTCE